MAETYAEKIDRIFNAVSKDNVDVVDEFYDSNVRFIDPLGEHQGIESVKAYYANLYRAVQEIRFEFHRHATEGQKVSSEWTMYLRASGLNGGDEIQLDGVSFFEFDEASGKVSYHRDYFDMGAFVYEQVPVLRSIIRFVKAKLKG